MRRLVAALAVLALGHQPAPPGMVHVPSGDLTRGRDRGPDDERPRHRVHLHAFWLDATLVTQADFAAFVAATGYPTRAEQAGDGEVALEGMDDWEWHTTPGASWREPFGPDAGIEVDPQTPVTMVAWYDADAYCRHAGKRLPTEAEWEYAMRAGAEGARFPWGNALRLPDGGPGFNAWQGESHHHNTLEDGYRYLSPVRAFPPNPWGLYDPVGNVWQLVADWYAPDTFERSAAVDGGARNPLGPDAGRLKVARGGSWWCSSRTCNGFGLFYRGKVGPAAALDNGGFRCAKDE